MNEPGKYRLVDPEGKEHSFSSFSKFAVEHAISYHSIMRVLRGRSAKVCGGWRLPNGVSPTPESKPGFVKRGKDDERIFASRRESQQSSHENFFSL